MGVVDQDYVDKTGDMGAIVGRKLTITSSEVGRLVDHVRAIAHSLSGALLPKLVSGQIRLRDAERVVESVA